MTAEIGLFLLILAFLVALMQSSLLLPVAAVQKWVAPLLRPAAWLQGLSITLALAVLITLRLDSDFSVVNVVANSNLTLPVLYKIVGTWGNHEGSMLLWVWVLAAFGAALALGVSTIEPQIKTRAIAVQSALCAGFLLFILFTSNPFERRFPPTADGEALNPLLQDIGLAMHPPLLYLGYVGFSIVFSLAVATLLVGKMDRHWAVTAHPWILAAWSALTIGIGLGSWWAYRVLGWGGFWFWDPVENVSLMPWLAGTALLHSNIVLKKRGILQQWVLLLAIITFALSLIGTFLVRSGALTSVHSFASDPKRGMFILAYIVLSVGAALVLFSLRAGKISSEGGMLPLSREGLIVINNLFLLTACATVLIGTLYPMLAAWLNDAHVTVGPPYFNITFLPLMAAPLFFAALAPFLPWKEARLKRAMQQTRPAALAALAAALLILAVAHTQVALAMLGFALAAWLAAASLRWILERHDRWASLPVFLGHFGAAVVIAGITAMSLWQQQSQRELALGNSIDVGHYRLVYDEAMPLHAPNYHGQRAHFTVTDFAGRIVARLSPEYRLYDIRGSANSIADIHSTPLQDIYAVIGESSKDGHQTAVRVYDNPMIDWIWGGCLLMALGGITGILRRSRP